MHRDGNGLKATGSNSGNNWAVKSMFVHKRRRQQGGKTGQACDILMMSYVCKAPNWEIQKAVSG